MLRIQAAEGGRTAARRRRAQEATSANPGASRVPIKELSRKSAGVGGEENRTRLKKYGGFKQSVVFIFPEDQAVSPILIFAGRFSCAVCWHGTGKGCSEYNIFESGGNAVIETAGTLDLTGESQIDTRFCGANGAIVPSAGVSAPGPLPPRQPTPLLDPISLSLRLVTNFWLLLRPG